MPVYLLKPHDAARRLWPDLDSVLEVVVVAADESQARLLAVEAAQDEGPAVWTDPGLTSCEQIRPDGPPRVVVAHSQGF